MENISELKSERRFSKQLVSVASGITLSQVVAWIMCFVFARASFFEVIKPFATAFYVSVSFTGVSKVFSIIFITLGNMVFSNFYEAIRQALTLLLFEAFVQLIFKIGNRKETNFSRSVIISIIACFTGLLKGVVQGLHLYDFVVSLLTAALVFSLAVTMAPAGEAFRKNKQKLLFDEKILFAKSVLLCAVVMSLKGIMIWQFEVGSVLAGVAVLVLARRRGSGVGACAGALLGMVIAIYDLPSTIEIPGMFALAGAAAGIPFKNRTSAAGMWTFVIIFFSGLTVLEGSLTIKYYEALAAGVLFLLIPQSLLNRIGDEFAGLKGSSGTGQIYDGGLAHEAADQLFVFSKALSRISRSIEDTINEDSDEEGTAAQWMIETVAEKVCNRCSLCERCWGTHFLKTYKLVEKSISDLKTDESGHIEVPVWFKNTCTKSDKFFENLSAAYSLYKAENVWKVRLRESRLLLARQASLVSGSIMTAARNLIDTSGRDFEAEERLLGAAGNIGIPVSNFRCHNDQKSRPFIEAVFEAKYKSGIKELDEMIKEAVQSSLVRVGETRRDLLGYSVVRYMKQPKFRTATGVARTSRESNNVSGDNFTFFISGEGCHISAISDGIGSGKRAERYSRTTIQMLENLIEDGIEIGLAIKLMNLYLNLRGENERLATMDICAIDLSTGSADFYKYNATCSLVKGRQGVITINTEDKDDENLTTSHYKAVSMDAGDFAIMVSDGILEAFSKEGEAQGLEWYIEGIDTTNAQELADQILQEAVLRLKGNHDDMTVLVTKLW